MTLINFWTTGFVGVTVLILTAIGFAVVVSGLLHYVSANLVSSEYFNSVVSHEGCAPVHRFLGISKRQQKNPALRSLLKRRIRN
jgi:hypothetical protein